MAVITDELAHCLRAWRERVNPEEVGIGSGGTRRVRGLRREEVAQLAGVSMHYLTRLEQGRAAHPSASVLAALARALRVSDEERAHLFRLASQPLPGPGVINTHIPASVQRLMDRLADVPVLVTTAAGEVLAANPLAGALMGEFPGGSRKERTHAWRHFTGQPGRVLWGENLVEAEEAMVADLKYALARYPSDTHVRSVIEDLVAVSPRFAQLWAEEHIDRRHTRRKVFRHPEVGDVALDCDALAVEGSDLRLIVYTAPAGSPAADALRLLSAIGLQSFELPA